MKIKSINFPPHPKNVEGDFYVVDGCCVACDLPSEQAPDMFKYDDGHCFVCKQPGTQEEVIRILNAMEIQDLNCIQYKGRDVTIINSLKQRNLEDCISDKFDESCDY